MPSRLSYCEAYELRRIVCGGLLLILLPFSLALSLLIHLHPPATPSIYHVTFNANEMTLA